MNPISTPAKVVALTALMVTLAACGGGGRSASGAGTLRLALTDAPACGFEAVKVTLQSVRVHQSETATDQDSGWQTLSLNGDRQVDLLTLTNGVLMELGQTPLPAGRYQQLRLVLAENSTAKPLANAVKPINNNEVALSTPSAQQSGLKLKVNMDVAPDQLADYVIDFDACRSVVKAGQSGQYLLKPVLSVLARSFTGLAGEVDPTSVGPNTSVALQSNGVTVRSSTPASNGSFLLQPVPAGNYSFVLQSPGRATTVVEAVTVGANAVARLHPVGTPLSPPVSAIGTLGGAVSATSLPDTRVRVLQALTNGPTVELINRPVDGSNGAYQYSVSTAAPQRANYAAGGALSFMPDTAAAGRFSLEALFNEGTQSASPLQLVEDESATVNFTQP
jgi:hypothetical protein